MKEAAELIARLRARAKFHEQMDEGKWPGPHTSQFELLRESADRIETLEARVATLSAALEPMAKCYLHLEKHPGELPNVTMLQWRLASEALAAREASR